MLLSISRFMKGGLNYIDLVNMPLAEVKEVEENVRRIAKREEIDLKRSME